MHGTIRNVILYYLAISVALIHFLILNQKIKQIEVIIQALRRVYMMFPPLLLDMTILIKIIVSLNRPFYEISSSLATCNRTRCDGTRLRGPICHR